MPKRNRSRSRRMRRGGLFGWGESTPDVTSSTGSTGSDSGLTSWFSSTKKPAPPSPYPASQAQSQYNPSTSQYNPSTSQYNPSSQPNYGGKKRRSKRMRGGYSANSSSTSLSNSMPFSGSTAKPHSMVGGRTRRYKHKRSRKTRRHR
jgi:hypothetical protein